MTPLEQRLERLERALSALAQPAPLSAWTPSAWVGRYPVPVAGDPAAGDQQITALAQELVERDAEQTTADLTILSTTTTSTGQEITATAWAPLPNTWSAGDQLSLSLARPALVRVELRAWAKLSNGPSTAEIRAGISIDGAAPPTTNAAYFHTASASQVVYQSFVASDVRHLAAGTHTAAARAYKGGSPTSVQINYALLSATLIRHTA